MEQKLTMWMVSDIERKHRGGGHRSQLAQQKLIKSLTNCVDGSEIERKDRGGHRGQLAQQKLLKSLTNCANNQVIIFKNVLLFFILIFHIVFH